MEVEGALLVSVAPPGERSVAPSDGTLIFSLVGLLMAGLQAGPSSGITESRDHAVRQVGRRDVTGAFSAFLFPKVCPTAQGWPPVLWNALYILIEIVKIMALGYIGPRTMCSASSPGPPPWVSTQRPSYNPGPASFTLGCPV